ncbi:hydroxypyruvate reductase [Nitrosovibrio sp. Nv17]|nr:hydroxypyruvate reductase [Nitrosovibrio sp. Nv17]
MRVVPPHLPALPGSWGGRILVVAVGKAAASMALGVERHWRRHAAWDRLEGIALTRYGHGLPLERIRVVEAGHPLPDARGEQAARDILDRVRALDRGDLLLCLISGGGSSLLSLPLTGVSLTDVRLLTSQLLRCGAPIQDINVVRKHLFAVHGGRLAAASRAPVRALIVSDVTGDDPSDVASGPCAPDPSTCSDALEVLARHRIDVPLAVGRLLRTGEEGESPKPGDAAFRQVENSVVATACDALRGAVAYFHDQGIPAVILDHAVTGEAREAAARMAGLSLRIRRHGQPWKTPVVLLSGGETTVTLAGGKGAVDTVPAGRGGRNSEFLLSLAVELGEGENIHALACDTDGIDGSERNAGAVVTPDCLRRARRIGMDARNVLARHDAYTFFERLGDLVITGPTRTNVNDYRAILIP